MIRVLFILSYVFCLKAQEILTVKDSFVVRVSNAKTGLKRIKALGYEVRHLGEDNFEISQGFEIAQLEARDEIQCVNLKSLIPEIRECSPNYVYTIDSVTYDPLKPDQWGLDKIGLQGEGEHAWYITKGAGVVVAVADTGVYLTHGDLASNLYINPWESENGLDDDRNGYVDDIRGWSGVKRSGDVNDEHGHGTHVAGIIAALQNGIGITGVAPEAKILPVQMLDRNGLGTLGWIISGLNYIKTLRQRGVNVRVINASWGGGVFSSQLQDLIEQLHNLGVVFVAAAGNSGSNNSVHPTYPANYRKVLSVASLNRRDELSFFSNYGNAVLIAAPGESIVSTLLRNNYGSMSGTSMAAPFVSGALALLFSRYPELSSSEAIELILDTCAKKAGLRVRNGCILHILNLLNKNTVPAPNTNEDTFGFVRNLVSLTPKFDLTSFSSASISDRDEGDYEFQVSGFKYNNLNVEKITVSTNQIIYFNQRRNALDFLPVRSLTLSNAISLLSTDWVNRELKIYTSDDQFGVFLSSANYYDYNSKAKVLLQAYKTGGFKVSYELNNSAFENLKDEIRILFFGNTEETRYHSFRPRFSRAEYNIVPRNLEGVTPLSLKLSMSENMLKLSSKGFGNGVQYGYFYVNNSKCQRRVPLAYLKGFARRVNIVPTGDITVAFRLKTADGNNLVSRGRVNNKKIDSRVTRDVCRIITRSM